MNQALFQWILGRIQAATNANYLNGQYGREGIAFRLENRNARYKSHQRITLSPGTDRRYYDLWVELPGNEGEGFGISAGNPKSICNDALLPPSHLVAETLHIPCILVAKLLAKVAHETGLPIDFDYSWCYVTVLRRRLIGWERDGAPRLASRHQQTTQNDENSIEIELIDLDFDDVVLGQTELAAI